MKKKARKIKERLKEILTPKVVVLGALFILALSVCLIGFRWMVMSMSHGDDALRVRSCETVAQMNSMNGMYCPVSDCPGNSGEECMHYTEGGYIGFYDDVSSRIVEKKPTVGYNESWNPEIEDKKYIGDRGTMVIRITSKDSVLRYEWIPAGKEKK